MASGLVRDPEFPAADVLLGPEAVQALDAAVAAEGGAVRQTSLTQVDYTPGRSVVAAYDAMVDWPDGPRREVLGAVARDDDRVLGERLADVGGARVSVWRYPDDPYLPGLRYALDPGHVADVLREAGVAPGNLQLAVRGYSPRSRAVIELGGEAAAQKLVFRPGQGFAAPPPVSVMFIKVLRPERARDLVDAHEALDGVIPIARCLYADVDRGLVAVAPLPGVPLWDCIVDGTHRPLDAGELLDVLDRIKDVALDQEARIPATESVRNNMRTLAALLPAQAATLERFAARLGDDGAEQPEITVHGDFHEVQLLVDERGLSGVLDLDDAGRGHRVDDMAMLLGRLWAYAQTEQSGGPQIEAYFWSVLEAWEDRVDPVELRRRIAAVAMNHALQPFRYQEPSWRAHSEELIAIADELLTRLLPDARASA